MITDFARYLSLYLLQYLPLQLGASTNTVASYRDTFTVFLRYCQLEKEIRPEKLALAMLNRELLVDFLRWLEDGRKCTVSTRNQRLSVLHAFSRFLHIEAPEYSVLCQQILSIPFKKTPQPTVKYLSVEGIRVLLAIPGTKTPSALRNTTLLTLLYDSGGRVQELADALVGDIRLSPPASMRLTGKGNKSRVIPLQSDTVALVSHYLKSASLSGNPRHPLFFNRYGTKLSRSGIAYILDKYSQLTDAQSPGLIPLPITPHCLRHSKAMHLLQAGVSLIYIRDILGHVDIKSTETYARADAEMKRAAIEAVMPHLAPSSLPSWTEDDALMLWLRNLCKSS